MAIQTFQIALETDHDPGSIITHDGTVYRGFFANIRIDRKTVPSDWHVYDIRDEDSNGDACEIKNGYVWVNHFLTFATKEPLPIKENESLWIAEDEQHLKQDEFMLSFD